MGSAAGLHFLATAVEVALYGQSVLRGTLRVDSKAPPALSPGVRSGISIGQDFGVPIEILPVDAEKSTRSQRSAVARAGKILRLRAAAGLRVKSLRVCGALGNDIDHAIDRIRSPQRAPRTADDFDAIDVFEQIVLHVPEHPRIKRRIDGPPIDHDQQLIAQVRIEPPCADGPIVRVLLRNLQIVGQAQRLRNARGAGTPDILVRYDLDRGGGLDQFFRMPRDRRHLDVHEVFDIQLFQLADGGRAAVRLGRRGANADRQKCRSGAEHRAQPHA